MKSRRTRKDSILLVVLVAAVAIVVGTLGGGLAFQREIKAYKNQILFFDPSWMCTAEYQGTRVVLAGDNQRKLINILDRCSRKFVWGEPEISDQICLTFKKDGEEWEMEISKTGEDALKLDLVGEDEYHVYVPNVEYFESIVEIISPEGKGTPNKAVGSK